MKKYITLLLLITLSCSDVKPVILKNPPLKEIKLRKNEIKLTKRHSNTFEVIIELNSVLKIPAILDSGASFISVPPYVIYTLIQTGTIKEIDYLPSRNYNLANGDIVSNPSFLIKEIKIGEYILKNVECSMSENNSSPILLGQNVLSKFKKVTVDYRKEVLILEK